MKIGFIGLGNMGAPIARNLLKTDYHLVVFDVVREAIEKFGAMGAVAATSPCCP
jgi:3-hydroxyisobutyrate dehydrogenase